MYHVCTEECAGRKGFTGLYYTGLIADPTFGTAVTLIVLLDNLWTQFNIHRRCQRHVTL